MRTFNSLVAESRLFQILTERLSADLIESPLYAKVGQYLDSYVEQNGLALDEILNAYQGYITSFNKHCKAFVKTGLYPLQQGEAPINISREAYDIVLILSALLTAHRFRIMQIIDSHGKGDGKRLFVGAGPGLELFLTQSSNQQNVVYDVELNEGLKDIFPDVEFHTDYFAKQYENHFDTVFLIELLEHLEDPYDLLQNTFTTLKMGGMVLLTTATDIPQFDHLYNFEDDHEAFESKVKAMGFEIVFKEKIQHEYLLMELNPSNHFYILKK